MSVRPIAAAGISAIDDQQAACAADQQSHREAEGQDATRSTASRHFRLRIWRLASSIAERVVAATSGSRATASPAATRTVSAASATASPTAAVRVVSSWCPPSWRSVVVPLTGRWWPSRSPSIYPRRRCGRRRAPLAQKRQRTTQGGGPGRPCETWRTPRHWRFQGLNSSTVRVAGSVGSHPFKPHSRERLPHCNRHIGLGGASAPGPPVAREPTWSASMPRSVGSRVGQHLTGRARCRAVHGPTQPCVGPARPSRATRRSRATLLDERLEPLQVALGPALRRSRGHRRPFSTGPSGSTSSCRVDPGLRSSQSVEGHDAGVLGALGGLPGDALIGRLLGDLGLPAACVTPATSAVQSRWVSSICRPSRRPP